MIEINAAQRLRASKLIALGDIDVKAQKTSDDCYEMIDKIQQDPRNVVGGLKAWTSGRSVEFTAAAKKKIAQLEKRAKELGSTDDEE